MENSVWEEIAPGKGALLSSIMTDDYLLFKKEICDMNVSIESILMAEQNISDLIIENHAFNVFLYIKNNERDYFKKFNLSYIVGILKNLYLSHRISYEEKINFVNEILNEIWTNSQKASLYINALLFAPKELYTSKFLSFKKYVKEDNFIYLISILSNQWSLMRNTIWEKDRYIFFMEEFKSLRKKYSLHFYHYLNSSKFSDELDLLRAEMYSVASFDEKREWVKYIFKNDNLFYHSTNFFKDYKHKFLPNIDEKTGKRSLDLNLDYIYFFSKYILPDIMHNKLTSSKLSQIKRVKELLGSNPFFIDAISATLDINLLVSFVKEKDLEYKMKKQDKKNSNVKLSASKKKKI